MSSEGERDRKSNSRLVLQNRWKKSEKQKADKYKNGQATMPEGQITDGQTELLSKCQGLGEAEAELDNIVRIESDSASMHRGSAMPIEKRRVREAEELSYRNVCPCFSFSICNRTQRAGTPAFSIGKRGQS